MEKTEIEKEDYEKERKKNSNVEYVMKEVYAQDNETPLDIAAAHNVLIKELLLANAHIKHLKPTALLFEGTVIIVPTNETIVREKNNHDDDQDEDDQNDDLGDDIFGVSSDDSKDSEDSEESEESEESDSNASEEEEEESERQEVASYDDETPTELAKRFNFNVKALLQANKHIKGLRADAKLWEGTKLIAPTEEDEIENDSSSSNSGTTVTGSTTTTTTIRVLVRDREDPEFMVECGK